MIVAELGVSDHVKVKLMSSVAQNVAHSSGQIGHKNSCQMKICVMLCMVYESKCALLFLYLNFECIRKKRNRFSFGMSSERQ